MTVTDVAQMIYIMKSTKVQTLSAVALHATTACIDDTSAIHGPVPPLCGRPSVIEKIDFPTWPNCERIEPNVLQYLTLSSTENVGDWSYMAM